MRVGGWCWTRWGTLAVLAPAVLVVVRAEEHAHRPTADDLIPLTCNENQSLFITLAARPDHGPAHRLNRPARQCRHQARSRAGHHRRQAASQA
ncbi:hypothetical protein ACFOOM_28290 [Streptomyces echinoruber]|uniref:hypothetical protein n=1 Tax=Streptomyces echinoruber TaxID=68898 RepID=UPI003612B662